MGPYERLLGDAMKGDATLFAREDMVESEWRVVDTILNHNLPVYQYEPCTWGPTEAASVIPAGSGTRRCWMQCLIQVTARRREPKKRLQREKPEVEW